ncbi:transcription factor IIIA [Bicyclus anynana]|uniref:Transcription factor IIIA n=1 Tax=Bicyclus anynana TaxID=110368 RepID=A0A6J1MZ19_BICAN|nr:transcription factor IIIA [Bicyclus anynana]
MEVIATQRVEPNKKIYACTFDGCTSVFERPYRLAQHRLVHDNVKPFTCDEKDCDKAYTSKSHLVRHINTAHKEAPENLPYCCPKCMKQYVNRQNLKRHIKVSHTDNNKPFNCDHCRLYFKKVHQLRAHMYVHNGVKPFSCSMCEREFVTLYEKKKHMRNHKVYKCEHCETKFTRWTELMHHKRVDHVSPEYICHDCGKVFKERGHVIRHVKKHLPNAPVTIFFCPYDNCLRHYSRNSNLKQHILVKHEGLTFDCSLCGAKLSTKAKLNEHIDRHNRPDLPPKLYKTLETGRKKRKDAGTIRQETAMRLAGIVKQKIEEGINRHYTEGVNCQDNFENDNKDEKEHLENKIHYNLLEERTRLRDVERELSKRNQSIELKVKSNYLNDSADFQDKLENATSELTTISQCIKEGSISSRLNGSVNFQDKYINNQPTSLIEILNRPAIKIENQEKTLEGSSNQLINSIAVDVKIESDGDNSLYNDDCKEGNESSEDLPNKANSEQSDTSNQPITTIKVENNTEEQSNENDYLRDGAVNSISTPSLPINNALSSLMQLYWRTLLNHKDV